jgi:hypothetical protein
MKALAIFGLLALAAEISMGQGLPSATLTGRVASEAGAPLAGVRVSVASAGLQGSRDVSTTATGEYLVGLLPPGNYQVSFLGEGLQPVRHEVQLTAAATARLNVTMRPAGVAEAITVSAQDGEHAPIGDLTVGANYNQKLMRLLPLDRTLRSAALLAPGVNDNGPSGVVGSANERPALMLSGAPSYDSLFLVNGVVVNENIRGQPQDLFVEDAIQETAVTTGRVSAEYGRFTGGVVTVVTKSGGNRLSGSFRITFTNDAWAANNPFDAATGADKRMHHVDETYETTAGGPLLTEHIWLFAAGRQASLSDSRSTRPTQFPGDEDPTSIPYVHGTDERRLEAKLTSAVASSQNFVLSYIEFHEDETNYAFSQNILDTAPLVPVTYESSLLNAHFGGIISENLLFEAQYAQRRSSIEQGGPELRGRNRGTVIQDLVRRGARFNSPVGKAGRPQIYDNEEFLLKASAFLATASLGSHDLRLGVERFTDTSSNNPYRSGSDFVAREGSPALIRGTQIFPVFDARTQLAYQPVLLEDRGTQLITNSIFLNDRVVLGRHWSLNLGTRYDRNDDHDGLGRTVSTSGSWSPRLAVMLDPGGAGRFVLEAGYARYVSKAQYSVVSSTSGAGQATNLQWIYTGPCINCNPYAPTGQLVPTAEALGLLFAWFDSIGGLASRPTAPSGVPGLAVTIQPGGLRSPSVQEYSLGSALALGARGSARVDLLHRDWSDFYSSRIDLSTGKSRPDPTGKVYDVAVIENSAKPVRRYTAAQLQLAYRLSAATFVGASYTWSRLVGNVTGELRCCGAVTAGEQYPEYTQAKWNNPTGYLSPRGAIASSGADQRNRARLWFGADLPLKRGRISLTLLESVGSGRPFEAFGSIDVRAYVTNPGYQTPPASVAYFFTRPAAFYTPTITQTDLAVTWTISITRRLEVFFQSNVLNLFNEAGVISVDATVLTLRPFDPFLEKPVRGVNYELGPYFGKPTSAADYQLPRTFRFSVGFRF